MTMTFETRSLDSLAKVFADEPLRAQACVRGSALLGEYFDYQIAYRSDTNSRQIRVFVHSDLGKRVSVRSVGLAPSELPNYSDHDDDLLRTTPGLYPDPLYPLEGGMARGLPDQWRSLWITVHLDEEVLPGVHTITVRFFDEAGQELGAESFDLDVIPASLPRQTMLHTEWLYLDCLATRYGVEAFSEDHWSLIAKYLENYAEHGMNMVLTPLFTPPLEMLFGKERPTVQLVDVYREGSQYSFNFARLERWIRLCLDKRIECFEFSHLFTQWGAKHAPKIIADDNERIFGWETAADGEDYRSFLNAFIPELLTIVRKHGLEGRCYFHVSDEPHISDLPSYRAASTHLRSLIGDFPIIDALSDYDFYSTGLLTHPVVSTEHIDRFIENRTPNLWAYYCCCEYKYNLSNRFFNMPSARTRVIGAQLYKYNIQGFLHWGYNHWYSQKSIKEINPYQVTDADQGFPSGDAFLVYPGPGGPVGSIRLALLREAMQDVRALQLLESLAGRVETLSCLEEGLKEPLTFRSYDHSEGWLRTMRERVNDRIKMRIGACGTPC